MNAQANAILRGAYHFLVPEDAPATGSADTTTPGVRQAQNYLKHVAPLATSDLPPCLDMEWYLVKDPATGYPKTDAQGQPLDFWANYTTAQIVAIAKDWLTTIEAQTGKKPIIYTSANWWKQRIGADTTLSAYKFWVADYGAKSLAVEQPRSPSAAVSPLWQFTENGSVTSANQRGVDVDVYHGSEDQFRVELGLPAKP